MRTPILLLAVAVLAVCFDYIVTSPSADVAWAQNTGPIPTPAVNPRLGAAPPGGHLDGRAASTLDTGAAGTASDPALPGGRLGTMNSERLGVPPAGAVSDAPTGAVAAPVTGAVPGPAAGAAGSLPGARAPAR